MADLKISQLTGATTPLSGTEVLPIVQSGTTKKVAVSDLTAGRTVAMTQLDVGNLRAAVNTISSTNTNGNIIIDPNGNGMTGVNMTPNSNSGQLQVAGQNATTSIAGIPTMSLVDGDANNEYCNLRYATSSDGSLGVIGFNAVTTGGYPSSVGALEIAIQNGAGSNTVLTGTAAGNFSVALGNVAFATAAKGVNFTANTGAAGMTSQLLNWYEEGTWTPSIGGTATYSGQTGKYTRIGRSVFVQFDITINVIGTGSTTTISGLPFTAGDYSALSTGFFFGIASNVVYISPVVQSGGTTIVFSTLTAAGASTGNAAVFGNGARISGSGVYFV